MITACVLVTYGESSVFLTDFRIWYLVANEQKNALTKG